MNQASLDSSQRQIRDAIGKLHGLLPSYLAGTRTVNLSSFTSAPKLRPFHGWLAAWGPDAPSGALILLETALCAYQRQGETVERGEWARTSSTATRAEAYRERAEHLRRHWGVGAYPWEEEEFEAHGYKTERSVRKWAQDLRENPSVIATVLQRLEVPPAKRELRGVAPSRPSTGVTAFAVTTRARESAWYELAEKRLARVQHPEGVEQLPLDVREVVARAMLVHARRWYERPNGRHPPGFGALLGLLVAGAPAMSSAVPHVPPVLTDEDAADRLDTSARRVYRVLMQRALCEPGLLEQQAQLARAGFPAIRPPVLAPPGATLERVRDVDLVVATSLVGSGRFDAESMRERQAFIRQSIGSSSPDRSTKDIENLFVEYLDARSRAFGGVGLNAREVGIIALADHGIAYDAVVFENPRILRLVGQHLGAPLPYRADLWIYTFRNGALTQSKSGNYLDALQSLARAEVEISRGSGTFNPVFEGEVREQILLARAGLLTRMIEALLLRANAMGGSRRNDDLTRLGAAIADFGGKALMYSRAASESVEDLGRQLGRLPTFRHAVHDSAGDPVPVVTNVTRAWRVMPAIQSLRASLAVRTAIEAGLVDGDEIFGGAGAAPTEDPQWWGDRRPELQLQCESLGLEGALGDLLASEELTPGHLPLVVPLAASASFLSGGRVVAGSRASDMVREITPFLASARPRRRRADDGGHEAPSMDWSAVVRWLSEGKAGSVPEVPSRIYDLNYLSWLGPPDGCVRSALAGLSNGGYEEFRQLHRGYRPDLMSHD